MKVLARVICIFHFKTDSAWTIPQNLGDQINTDRHEMCPYVTTDGKLFLFASGRQQEPYMTKPGMTLDSLAKKNATHDNGRLNIYSISTDFIDDLRQSASTE